MKEKPYPPLWILFAFLVPILALYYKISPEGFHFDLVDARVYAVAIHDWLSGEDAYRITPQASLLYVYPPVFLYVAGWLARLLTPQVGWIVYLTLHIVATLALPWILYRFYLLESDCRLQGFYSLFFAAPGFLGLLALRTGNIAVICWAAMLLAGSRGLIRNRWFVFYVVVFLCCSIKITFLPILLLPALCGRKQWPGIAVCAIAAAAGLWAQRWLTPTLYEHFQRNLKMQGSVMGDMGKGAFGILFHILHKAHHPGLLIPTAGYAIVALAVMAALVALRRRGCAGSFVSWPALVLTGILFMTPRVNYYDLCFGMPLAIVMLVRVLRIKNPYLLYVCLFGPSIAFLVRSPDTALNGGFEAMTILVFFFLTYAGLAKTQPVFAKKVVGTHELHT
jgi:hypothetical protein